MTRKLAAIAAVLAAVGALCGALVVFGVDSSIMKAAAVTGFLGGTTAAVASVLLARRDGGG